MRNLMHHARRCTQVGVSAVAILLVGCAGKGGDAKSEPVAAKEVAPVSAAASGNATSDAPKAGSDASSGNVAQTPPQAPPVRVRGTVQKLDKNVLTVKARDGSTVNIKLADNFAVLGITKARLADVAKGKFIGTATLGERNGALIALEVHILPETMRGIGEGHFPWDLKPESKMTNANVAEVASIGKDRVLTVQYKGGEQKILIPKNAKIVTYVPADRKALKRGAPIFAVTQRQPDGSLTAARVSVGVKGTLPPM